MKTIEIDAAGTDFHTLVEEAAGGEEIIFAKAGKPMARLTPIHREKFDRQPGRLRHLIRMKDNFDNPLPPEIAEAFGMDS